MFTKEIKNIKKALSTGSSVMKEQTQGLGLGEKTDAIYVNGKLAVIVSKTLLPCFMAESKKAKLNLNLISRGPKGCSLI